MAGLYVEYLQVTDRHEPFSETVFRDCGGGERFHDNDFTK